MLSSIEFAGLDDYAMSGNEPKYVEYILVVARGPIDEDQFLFAEYDLAWEAFEKATRNKSLCALYGYEKNGKCHLLAKAEK